MRTAHTRCPLLPRRMGGWWSSLLVIVAASLGQAAEPAGTKPIDFARQIRPILSDNCFNCHGPDEKSRKSGLRLDLHEDALKPAKSGHRAIVPGNIAESDLVKRIETTDPDDVMPPPKFGKTLSAAQKDLLKRWIAEGATWMTHWAYEPPKRAALPNVTRPELGKNEIDRFVLARLEKEQLSFSEPADKVTLLRRASLDLTGLPPTPAQVDAFVADPSPEAYEKQVDQLLQSPHYGEHLARYWLDAARYADSHGYHIDSERQMWKYRDWVVNSFNKNKPFDQFTIEQLAGDLLPNPTLEQKTGSGFIRANMSTGEGGAIIDEYQAKYTFDRTETAGTIWLGLTMVCSRCHSHKYDPISHREYYGLYSFFNNLKESVMDGNVPNPDPSIQVPSTEQSQRLEELRGLIKEGKTKVEASMPELDIAQQAWEKQWRDRLSKGWELSVPSGFHSVSNAQFEARADGSILVSGSNPPADSYEMRLALSGGVLGAVRLEALPDPGLPLGSSARSTDGKFRLSEFEMDWAPTAVEGQDKERVWTPIKFSRAIADSAIKDREIEKAIDGKADTGWQPTDAAQTNRHTALFVLEDALTIPANSEVRLRLKFQASQNRRAMGRFRVSLARSDEFVHLLSPPKPAAWQVLGALRASDPATALVGSTPAEQELDLKKSYAGAREEVRWTARTELGDGKEHVLVSGLHGVHGIYYLLRTLQLAQDQRIEISVRADDLFRVWLNGELVGERSHKETPGEGPLRMVVNLKKGENKFLVKMVNVQGDSRFQFSQSSLDERVLPPELAGILAGVDTLSADQASALKRYYRRAASPEWRKEADQLARSTEEEEGLNRTIPTTMVAREEMEKPRDTFILMRGEYDKPSEKVARITPAILPPFPREFPTNRLGLAQWLLLPSHPLTARVTVNRFWQQFFGVGLVKTTEDFGVQGEAPSHPELLDWLATEFIQSGWNIKALQRLIVTSATYRQSSKLTADLLHRDPENRLLARGPRFRVDGEVVRDTALYVSGLMVEQLGGRSARPYEPPGLWEAVSFNNSQKYIPDEGELQYRRSLYTHWKRQSPPPNMLLFDAPSREYCVVRRPRTNTPLQALTLLNDPQFVESARAFADRVLRQGGGSTESRIAYAFRLATARKPTEDEIGVMRRLLQEQLSVYRQNPAAAKDLLAIGAFRPTSGVAPEELAAWSTLASLILNLDETVTKI